MSGPVTVALATLGCRLNQVESREIGALLEGRGFRVVEAVAAAQVCVINTCTVTGRADFSDRQLIRRIGRENPDAYLVVTGCYAQTNPEAAAAIRRGATWSWAIRRSTACPSCSARSPGGRGPRWRWPTSTGRARYRSRRWHARRADRAAS